MRTKNHFFLTGQPFTNYFAITFTGVVTLRRDVLVVVHPFMTYHFYVWSGLYSGMCIGTRNMDASPRSPSLGNIPGKLLSSTPGGIKGKESNKGLAIRN